MERKVAKKRIEKLRKLINYHRYLYHVLDKQEISEAALDSLKKELFDLEQEFPEFITPDSPSQRVGGKSLDKFEKITHKSPMLSLSDAFSKEDLENWNTRNLKLLTEEEKLKVDFFCELKMDGLAVELVFENSLLKTGATRGDGIIGEDVTQNIKTIESIPLKIRDLNEAMEDMESNTLKYYAESFLAKEINNIVVRGEIFVTKKEFEKTNKEQEKKGLPAFANPRNMAAGSIRQLDPNISASRKLDFCAYDIILENPPETHKQKHEILKILGFKIIPENKYCKNLKEVLEFHKLCQRLREKLAYEIDGIVVNVNTNRIFEKLGVAGKAPRASIAFKFPLKQAVTIVEDIFVQVGRTGALTPVARLKPVGIGGAVISKATLHNEDEIKRSGLKIGDTVIVGRAGDVIPDIIKVLTELRTGKEKNFFMPRKCPVCGTNVVKQEKEAVWRCPNPECFARQKEYLYHFVSRQAFNIAGLGPKIIDRLIDEGLIQDASDLFLLREGDIAGLERFAEKSAGNLIKSIAAKKQINFQKFIYSLGIRNVGEETAYDLAGKFRTLENLKDASVEELLSIRDIGEVSARSIFEWFREKRNLSFLNKLSKVGVKIEYKSMRKENFKLKNKKFVFTGNLKTITRNSAKEKVKELGGQVSESVSKNVDFLVLGENPGSKLKKARELGIRIVEEKDFLNILNT